MAIGFYFGLAMQLARSRGLVGKGTVNSLRLTAKSLSRVIKPMFRGSFGIVPQQSRDNYALLFGAIEVDYRKYRD
jgi:hypothetical protein